MRRIALAIVLLLAVPLFAAELARADGALTIDKDRLVLGYAYAIGHQRNDITKRRDEIKVVLTDKPLASDVNLNEIDFNFPDGVLGIVIHLGPKGKVTHVVVQHRKGMYDGGFVEDWTDFRFRNANGSRGTIAGRVTSSRIQTNTMSFSVDVDFNALVQ